jgi:hypothetical protein
MLCEQCQKRDSNVHVTLVIGLSAETTSQDFCDPCYSSEEAERLRAYNSQPCSALPEDVEHISALEYLEASARADRNGVDNPAFKHIQEQVNRLPMTRQRIVFEMLPLAWQSLELGEEPGWTAGFAGCCWGSIEPQRLSEYTTWLEKIIVRCFELRGQLPDPPGENGPFAMTLSMMLVTLGKVERGRFTAVLESLK